MRYDLTVPITDLDGVQITDASDTAGYTLRSVLVRTALYVDRIKLPTAAEKLAAYGLAKRVATANHFIDLEASQVAILKEKAGALWSPLVMGQVWELLETPVTLLPAVDNLRSGGPNDGAAVVTGACKPTADIPAEG